MLSRRLRCRSAGVSGWVGVVNVVSDVVSGRGGVKYVVSFVLDVVSG